MEMLAIGCVIFEILLKGFLLKKINLQLSFKGTHAKTYVNFL